MLYTLLMLFLSPIIPMTIISLTMFIIAVKTIGRRLGSNNMADVREELKRLQLPENKREYRYFIQECWNKFWMVR